MPLELTSLERAIVTLAQSLDSVERYRDSLPEELRETLRSGIIQNFEVAYELSWKMMKRWLEQNLSPDIADGVPRRELYRLAVESRLIDDVERWMVFHRARNESSHTYDFRVAESVERAARPFLDGARLLLQRLKARND